jgi:hypothetical protein
MPVRPVCRKTGLFLKESFRPTVPLPVSGQNLNIPPEFGIVPGSESYRQAQSVCQAPLYVDTP